MLKTAENGNLKFDRIKVHVSHLISPSASHRHTYLLIYWYNIDSYVIHHMLYTTEVQVHCVTKYRNGKNEDYDPVIPFSNSDKL